MSDRIVFIDLETGGVESHHPDIQLAGVAVGLDLAEVERFEAKIQFDVAKCDPEALELNAYDANEWLHFARPERVVVSEFAAFLRKHSRLERVSKAGKPYKIARVAGHNIRTFDGPRLLRMFERHGEFLPAAWYWPLDTMELALWFYNCVAKPEPENYRLETLAAQFGIYFPESGKAHDALGDCLATVALARRILLDWRLKAVGRAAGLPGVVAEEEG